MRANVSMHAAIGTLIVATSIIQLANGFFGTFLSLRVALEGFEITDAGLVLSSYFAGFTLGAVRSDRIIPRIGHIRAYAAFAGLVGAATAVMPLLVDPYAWGRLAGGRRLWLRRAVRHDRELAECEGTARHARPRLRRLHGRHLHGCGGGQLLIGHIDVASPGPFNAIVALFAMALVMVSFTRAEPPQVTAATRMPFRELAHAAPIAVAGCDLSGLIAGTFYALVPAWMEREGIVRETIALFMFVAVAGGLVFQVPIGRLSDRLAGGT